MTLQDLMDMPREKQLLIEDILNHSLSSNEAIKYCIDRKYIRYSEDDKTKLLWDGIKIFQLPIEEMKKLANMVKK